MAIICSLCGKNQSGWITDFALANHLYNHRVCVECHEELEKTKKINNNGHSQESITYFSSCMKEYNSTLDVKLYIEALIESLKNNSLTEDISMKIELKKEREINSILITSGYNYEGYSIIKYCDYISAEIALGLGFFNSIAANLSNIAGIESNSLKNKLSDAKKIVIRDIKQQTYDIGANAIIGIDIDYTMFGDSIVGVIASGTAVNIEKNNT